jgi:hypothetical protein
MISRTAATTTDQMPRRFWARKPPPKLATQCETEVRQRGHAVEGAARTPARKTTALRLIVLAILLANPQTAWGRSWPSTPYDKAELYT